MTDLDQLAAAAAVLRRQSNPDLHPFADAFDDFAAGRVDSIDRALGLAPRPGRSTNTNLARLNRRDNAIRVAAAKYTGSPQERGRALYRDLAKYAGASYRTDRRIGAPPDSKAHLFAILQECVEGVPGAPRLAQIIRKK